MGLLGKPAPNFSLPDSEGNKVSLEDFKGKKVLLVFYPGDETLVCTKQLCSYNSGFEEFVNLGVNILGINTDSIESHKKFRDKYKLQFPLLSDKDGDVCKLYNAKSLIGVKRVTFLVDEKGNIIFENDILPVLYKDKDDIIKEVKKLI
ncbi:MAG: peroxiredoxin [Leptospiraceae bacterium]|nr:peroxiredoxin [Leptospiraceae bacterium]